VLHSPHHEAIQYVNGITHNDTTGNDGDGDGDGDMRIIDELEKNPAWMKNGCLQPATGLHTRPLDLRCPGTSRPSQTTPPVRLLQTEARTHL